MTKLKTQITLITLSLFIITSTVIAESNSENLIDLANITKGKLTLKGGSSSNFEYTLSIKKGKVLSLRMKDTNVGKRVKGKHLSSNSTEFALLCLTDQKIDCYDSTSLVLGRLILCF